MTKKPKRVKTTPLPKYVWLAVDPGSAERPVVMQRVPVCTLGVPGCTGHYDSKGNPVKSWR